MQKTQVIHFRRLHQGRNVTRRRGRTKTPFIRWDQSALTALCCCHAGLMAADPRQSYANAAAIKAANNVQTNSRSAATAEICRPDLHLHLTWCKAFVPLF